MPYPCGRSKIVAVESWREIREELGELIRSVVTSTTGLSDEARARVREDVEHLRRLVVAQRTPRVAVVGKMDVPLVRVLEPFGATVEHGEVLERLGHGRWYDHQAKLGRVRLADLRCEDRACLKPLDYERPDLCLAVARSEDEDVEIVADALLQALERVDDHWTGYPPAVVAVFRESDGRNAGDFKTIQAFKDAFVQRGLSRDFVEVVAASRSDKLARAIVGEAPDEIRIALARMTDDRVTKRQLADDLVGIASSLSAAIATIPIPVADIVPITTVQMTMIAGVAYLSGRDVDVRNIAEFLTAMGLNVGAGLALRSLVRALVKLIPVAGPVVSATVAAGATKTLGRAAMRHYLDPAPSRVRLP